MPSHNRGHLTWVFLILDEGYLLPAAALGLRHGLAGLGRLPNLRQGVAPLGHASARSLAAVTLIVLSHGIKYFYMLLD